MGIDDPHPPVGASDAHAKSPAGTHCRQTAGVALRAFLDLIEETAVDGKISVEAARRVAEAIMAANGPIATVYSHAEIACEDAFTTRRIESQRRDRLGWLITQNFAHLLDDPQSGIGRKNLAQFFAAIRMILGDEMHETMRARCAVLAELYRTPEGIVDWDRFYVDAEADLLREQVLVAIARSFRRFEPRVDWFLIVMNCNATAVSLGSGAFIPRKPDEKIIQDFSIRSFCHLFQALFEPVRPESFDVAGRAAFAARWGSPPEKIFGPLLVELQGLCRQGKA